MKAAMLRAQREGIAATFSWLAIVMHVVMASLMIFLLGILEQFGIRLDQAMSSMGGGAQAMGALGLQQMFTFSAPQVQFLYTITVWLIILLAAINAFAIVASQGAHLIKMSFYLSILFVLSGACFLFIPSLVKLVM